MGVRPPSEGPSAVSGLSAAVGDRFIAAVDALRIAPASLVRVPRLALGHRRPRPRVFTADHGGPPVIDLVRVAVRSFAVSVWPF